MNKFYLLIIASLIFSSCSQEELPIQVITGDIGGKCLSLNEKAINNYIAQRHIVKSRTNTCLMPIIKDGDTVAYLANYVDGWELFSNDNSLPMVIMKSEKGSFYPNSELSFDCNDKTFSDFYNTLIENLALCPKEDVMHESWALYSNEDGDRDKDVIENPTWVGNAVTVVKETYTPKGGRLKTQWNQGGNYNMFTPFYEDSVNIHCYLGCGAVAVGQMVYHSNKYFGVPTSTVTKATYDERDNWYLFSEPSSSVWSLMDSGDDPSFCEDPVKMMPTAVFLGYMARVIGTNFGLQYGLTSGSYPNIYIPYLRQMLNVRLTAVKINWNDIVQTLKYGYPVYTTGENTSQRYGHVYLIDQADLYQEIWYDVYGIKLPGNDEDVDDREESPDSPGQSLDYYKERYKDVSYDVIAEYTERWLMMNWGGTKSLNNVKINADDKIFKISSYQYDENVIYKVN